MFAGLECKVYGILLCILVYSFNMDSHSIIPCRLVGTMRTLIWLFSGMCPHVGVEGSLSYAIFPTYRAIYQTGAPSGSG